jgi:hypothetical protein
MPRTAIVCAAAYMKGSGYGPEIDSYGRIVRVNTGFEMCSLYPDDIGNTTHICYINSQMFRERSQYKFPPGSRIIRKSHVNGYTRDLSVGYEANTGILAVLHFASMGYTCKVFGMDFFSSPYGGIIPENPSINDGDKLIVPRESIYLSEYNRERYGDQYKLAHFGGIRDFRILYNLMQTRRVTVDDHMMKIVELNKHRV